MLAKYDTSFIAKDQNVYSVLFIFRLFTLRELTIISLGKRLVLRSLTVSRCKTDRRISSRFRNAVKLGNLLIEQAGILCDFIVLLASFNITATRNSPGYLS